MVYSAVTASALIFGEAWGVTWPRLSFVMWKLNLSTSRMRTILKAGRKSTFLMSDMQRGYFLHSWHVIYPVSDQTVDQESDNFPGDRASAMDRRSSWNLWKLHSSYSAFQCPTFFGKGAPHCSKEHWQSVALGHVLTIITHSHRFTTIIQRKLRPVPKMGKSWQWRMGWWACNVSGGSLEWWVWADGGKCRKMKETQEIGMWVIGVMTECCGRAGGEGWVWDGDNVAPTSCCLILAWQSF